MTTKEIVTGFISGKLKFVSTGLCPDCTECMSAFGYDDIDKFNNDVESQEIVDEGSFSWNPCDDCNRNLGGDSFYAHGIDENGELIHFQVCYNCLFSIEGYTICENCDHVCADYGAHCYNCGHDN